MLAPWSARVYQEKQSYAEQVEKQKTGYPDSIAKPCALGGRPLVLHSQRSAR